MTKGVVCLPIEEFIAQVPGWHRKYLEEDYRRGREGKRRTVRQIEQRIQESASRGSLNMDDIVEVVLWGGGSRLLGRIRRNTPEHIERCTSRAVEALRNPEEALGHVMRIGGLGESFGSKVLAFLSPETCPVLDRVVRGCLSKACNWDNESATYSDFIALCEYIAEHLPTEWQGRDVGGIRYLRDIEMALFQYAWREEDEPRRYITGTLPL